MHVLIATDGSLDPATVVPFVKPLTGADGRATVVTVVELSRNVLRDLRALYGERTIDRPGQDAEYVGIQADASSGVSGGWPGDDEMINRYVEDQLDTRTSSLRAALGDADVTTSAVVRDGENAATEILAVATELDVDAICIGSHGRGLFDGFLGSTGTRVARRAPVPVLLIRSRA